MAQRCSDIHRSSGEPLYGTATIGNGYLFLPVPIRFWSDVEFNERWASKRVLSLIDRCVDAGVRVRLYDPSHSEEENFRGYGNWCSARPALELIEEIGLRQAARSKSIDFFVCVHGKRDQCCALYGQAVYASACKFLSGRLPIRNFRASHLGGDRFAATGIAFPSGNMYGALDASNIQGVLAAEADGCLELRHYRGSVFDTKEIQLVKYGLLSFEGISTRDASIELLGKDDLESKVRIVFVFEKKRYRLVALKTEFDFVSSCRQLAASGKSVRKALVLESLELLP